MLSSKPKVEIETGIICPWHTTFAKKLCLPEGKQPEKGFC